MAFPTALKCLCDSEVTQRGGMENGVHAAPPGFGSELGPQILVCCEGHETRVFERKRGRCAHAFEAENLVPLFAQRIGKEDAKFTSREIRNPSNLIDWFVAGSAGDDDFQFTPKA